MTVYITTLKGNVPSKKNSKRRVQRGSHVFMIPSVAHETWHTEQMLFFKGRYSSDIPLLEVVKEIELKFYNKDKRGNDLSNKAESVMDLLVDAGKLKDDNWFVVPVLVLKFGGVDKMNPRVVITIRV